MNRQHPFFPALNLFHSASSNNGLAALSVQLPSLRCQLFTSPLRRDFFYASFGICLYFTSLLRASTFIRLFSPAKNLKQHQRHYYFLIKQLFNLVNEQKKILFSLFMLTTLFPYEIGCSALRYSGELTLSFDLAD